MQVFVRDNDVNAAIRVLKKRMQREGTFREMKRRRFISRKVPSRCILFFKTRIAALTSLSRTKTCTGLHPFLMRT